jgi:hypothetical protein
MTLTPHTYSNTYIHGTDLSRDPLPGTPQQKEDVWSVLKLYVQNDVRINLNTQSLKKVLTSYDDMTLPGKSLRRLIGACVNGYVKGSMNDDSKLNAVKDYLELLGILLPLSGDINSPDQKYMINVSGELQEDADFFSEKSQLTENIKSYVKLLIG